MTIEKAIHLLFEEYTRIKDNPGIQKPVAWSLYQVWKYADSHEKSRKISKSNKAVKNED